ncbi:MAG: sulfite exporter TauE/SafE family protein, partial [Moorea sp. SIO4G2]|nr:sulfite exporter TauE/SafE family protein [Moorena sp. SIO4G2]
MTPTHLLIFAGSGLLAGILAGFLGIGGGVVLVPLLVALGYQPVQAAA